jgi:hypothetical protein
VRQFTLAGKPKSFTAESAEYAEDYKDHDKDSLRALRFKLFLNFQKCPILLQAASRDPQSASIMKGFPHLTEVSDGFL